MIALAAQNKDYISQPPLQHGVTMWLGYGQWDVSRTRKSKHGSQPFGLWDGKHAADDRGRSWGSSPWQLHGIEPPRQSGFCVKEKLLIYFSLLGWNYILNNTPLKKLVWLRRCHKIYTWDKAIFFLTEGSTQFWSTCISFFLFNKWLSKEATWPGRPCILAALTKSSFGTSHLSAPAY